MDILSLYIFLVCCWCCCLCWLRGEVIIQEYKADIFVMLILKVHDIHWLGAAGRFGLTMSRTKSVNINTVITIIAVDVNIYNLLHFHLVS